MTKKAIRQPAGRQGADDRAALARWLDVDPVLLLSLSAEFLEALGCRHAEALEARHAIAAYVDTASAASAAITDLQRRVNWDALTGVLSRPGIEEQRDRELRRSLHGGGALAVLVVDIDGLKLVNDRLGHAAGDALLQAAAAAIGRALRPGDSVGRVGGDEFVCVAPGADLEQAAVIARRIAASADHADVPGELRPLHLSLGWASTAEGIRDATELTVAADRRLYDERRRVRQGSMAPIDRSLARRRATRTVARTASLEERVRVSLAHSAELLRRGDVSPPARATPSPPTDASAQLDAPDPQ